MGVTLDRYGGREAGNGEGSVGLREGCGEHMANITARGEEACDRKDQKDRNGDGEEFQKATRTARRGISAARTPGEEVWFGFMKAHRYPEG